MTDETDTQLEEQPAPSILRRVEIVRAHLRRWNLTAGDPGHLDVDDPTSLDPDDPPYVRADHPALPAYYARIDAESHEPLGRPDDPDDIRRRANS